MAAYDDEICLALPHVHHKFKTIKWSTAKFLTEKQFLHCKITRIKQNIYKIQNFQKVKFEDIPGALDKIKIYLQTKSANWWVLINRQT